MSFPFMVLSASTSTPALPDTSSMWSTITTGAGEFITGIVSPVLNVCASNAIVLLFLSVTFISRGVSVIRKMIGAFGRGR